MSWLLRLFCCSLFLAIGTALICAQETKLPPEEPDIAAALKNQVTAERQACTSITEGLAHEAALESFCEWVLSFDTKLPNIIGDQDTKRLSTNNGKEYRLLDTTGARVAYVDGKTQYSDLTINHVKITVEGDIADNTAIHGSWSFGEYGSDLRWLFNADRSTHFNYVGESSLRGSPLLVFEFEVFRADNHHWELRFRGENHPLQATYPGYRGRILLDKATSRLVRFEKESTAIDEHFPLRFGSKTTEYQSVPLGDGTEFVLPTESVSTMCTDKKHRECNVNDTTFQNWQKFAAKSRILTDTQPQ